MKEKNLIKQLNNLKAIAPDQSWKEANREILRSQIFSGQLTEKKHSSFYAFFDMAANEIYHKLSQPAAIVAMIIIAASAGGFFSVNAARESKPGDGLYIAKRISEKTQYALTFDETKKVRLNISFANERAKELEGLNIENGADGSEQRAATVAQLTEDVKKEISTAKSRLKEITPGVQKSEDVQKEAVDEEPVFSANLGKADSGVSLVEEGQNNKNNNREEEKNKEEGSAEDLPAPSASTTPEIKATLKTVLEEARVLMETEDISGTLNKLEEVDNIITPAEEEKAEVLGEEMVPAEEETASTSVK